MSIKTLSNQGSLFDSGLYLEEMLTRQKGAEKFLFFRKNIWPKLLSLGPSLNAMYCVDNGRPAVNPVRLLAVTLLQYMEKMPDRQAVDAIVFDIRWKCALEMEVDEGGFDSTVLVRFRERLREHGLEGIGLEAALEGMREAGYYGKKTAYRVDSMQVLGLVAQMSRLECVRETMRLVFLALEREARLARPDLWSVWWERYVESKVDYREKEDVLRLKMIQAGEDIQKLLLWMESMGKDAPKCEEVELLKRVFGENFECAQSGVEKRKTKPSGSVSNPHDPQAQWSFKDAAKRTEWVGYKAQIVETVEEQPRKKGEPTKAVITAIVIQEAIASDKAALPVVEQAIDATGEPRPEKLYADAGYTSGDELARAQKEGRELRGPVQPGAPRKDGGYTSEAFDVSIANRSALCPAGQRSTNCSRLRNGKTGDVDYRFEWERRLCEICDRSNQCLGKDQSHRTLLVGEHHDLIQSRRQEQKTEAFKKDMRHRNAIEGTISELCRGYGLRHCRYRGINKTRLQSHMIAAACNIKRWWRRVAWELREAMKAIMNGQ
ncbi:transposase, partial [Candidatus Poribacteria bacterium]|nr:transposase [Candidatus Poribacteria bacterium]